LKGFLFKESKLYPVLGGLALFLKCAIIVIDSEGNPRNWVLAQPAAQQRSNPMRNIPTTYSGKGGKGGHGSGNAGSGGGSGGSGGIRSGTRGK
jgi:hypothetical protein